MGTVATCASELLYDNMSKQNQVHNIEANSYMILETSNTKIIPCAPLKYL